MRAVEAIGRSVQEIDLEKEKVKKLKGVIIKRKITGIIDDSFPDIIRGSRVVAEWEEEYGCEEEIRDTQESKKIVKRLVVTKIKNKKLNSGPG